MLDDIQIIKDELSGKPGYNFEIAESLLKFVDPFTCFDEGYEFNLIDNKLYYNLGEETVEVPDCVLEIYRRQYNYNGEELRWF